MKVVSDTSPLCYLLLIGRVELLKVLFGRVHIPEAVRDELSHPGAPPEARTWISSPPDWLEIHAAFPQPGADLVRLHKGEQEAIVLAGHLNADLVLLDDKKARRVAQDRGQNVVGLLGVIDRAVDKGLLPLMDALERLGRTTFRAEPRLIKTLLDRHLGDGGDLKEEG